MGLSTIDCGYQFRLEMVAKVSKRNGDWPTITKKQSPKTTTRGMYLAASKNQKTQDNHQLQ
jgi:hypothetical protein